MWMAAASGLPSNYDVVSLAVDPTTSSNVIAGVLGGSGVYRTTDGGASWTPLGVGLGSSQVAAVALDPATPTRVLAATDQGVWSVAGGTWSSVGLTSQSVTALAFARSHPQTIYAGTLTGGVFRSDDGGTSWTAYSVGLSSVAIARVAVDPTNPDVAYAGTSEGGVYKVGP
jgi:photosystem II stability/assembly factor-like uncharacterized protein